MEDKDFFRARIVATTNDPFVNATYRIRLGRAYEASDADIRADLEKMYDADILRFAFVATDMLK